jgi:hypothetical protein
MFILILLCLIFTAAKKASIEQSSQEGQQFQEGCQDILDWVSDLREKLQEQPLNLLVFSGVSVARSSSFCVVFCRSLFVLFFFIVLSILH